MCWVTDLNDDLVNLNRWDMICLKGIRDVESGEIIANKYYLQDRELNTHILGYMVENPYLDIKQLLVKGIFVEFESLKSIVYDYLNKKKQLPSKKGDFANYDEDWLYVKSLIDTRFVESVIPENEEEEEESNVKPFYI